MVEPIAKGQGLIGKLLRDEGVEKDMKSTLASLASASARLGGTLKALDDRKSALGRAIHDPAMGRDFESHVANIERSAGRLEIDTERETLDLRERFDKVSADYNRAQFRLGSLQHLNTRLGDPRVAQQLDELVLELRRLATKT